MTTHQQRHQTSWLLLGAVVWLIVWLFLSCATVHAQTVLDTPCDYWSISNSCAVAHEGDIVQIRAGSCTISNTIIINNSISFSIAGAGTNQTTLRSAAGLAQMVFVASDSSNVFAIHDLNIVGNSDNTTATIVFGNSAVAGSCPGPFHIYNLQMTNVAARGISVGGGGAFGLIDHCNMKSATGYLQMIDFQGAASVSWTNANPIGTTNVCCVEDCVFIADSAGNGFFDAYNGAQVVFRHNLCYGHSPIGAHGYDSNQYGIRTWEVYNNVFTNYFGNDVCVDWRGGSGVVYSNSFYGYSGSIFCALDYYRVYPELHNNYGTCPNCYIAEGVPGKTYTINFTGWWPSVDNPGQGISVSNNLVNGYNLGIGFTPYYFYTNLSQTTYHDISERDVLIGATTAETITNLMNAINLGPGNGVAYTNPYSSFLIGSDYLATGCDTTNLYLRNALDSTNAFGYPAEQQIGVIRNLPLTGSNFIQQATLWPAYCWSNNVNGVLYTNGFLPTSGYGTNVVKLGRDFINDVVPAPATYTPLVYPHPLVSATNSPVPPTHTVFYLPWSLAASTNSVGGNVWVDNADTSSIDGSTTSMLIFVSGLLSATASGTIDQLRVNVASVTVPGGAAVKMAIYDSGGTLVGQTTPVNITAAGWNYLSLATSFSVTAGQSYRVDFVFTAFDASYCSFSTSTSASSYYNYTLDYASFPTGTQYTSDGTPGFGAIVVGYHIQ